MSAARHRSCSLVSNNFSAPLRMNWKTAPLSTQPKTMQHFWRRFAWRDFTLSPLVAGVAASDEINGVGQHGHYDREALAHALGAARQVDDERRAAAAGDRA